jgi:hypothetical protein
LLQQRPGDGISDTSTGWTFTADTTGDSELGVLAGGHVKGSGRQLDCVIALIALSR